MNKTYGALIGTALALPLTIGTALAGPMDTGTKIACTEVKYSTEFLAKFPNSPAACLEAREQANGKRYAKFNARIYLNSADRTTVELLNVKGDRLSTFSIKPAADAGVMIDGKKVKFTDLKKGDVISFWVSEDRLSTSDMPEDTAESWSVLPPE